MTHTAAHRIHTRSRSARVIAPCGVAPLRLERYPFPVVNRRRAAHLILRSLLIIALPLLGIAGYVTSRHAPAGAAAGDARSLTQTTQPVDLPRIRIASYNVHSLIGVDGKADPQRTADMLRGFDLVGLQETRGYFYGSPRSQAELLGQKLGLNSLFAPTEHTRFHDDFGNGVLTRLPVDAWFRIPLPGTQSSGHRNVLMLRTRLAGKPLTVLITHVDRVHDRAAQLQALWQLFSSIDGAAVIMGDFNTKQNDPLLKPFLTNSTDAVAVGGTTREDRIDWIFTRNVTVVTGGLTDSPASDHPLVWAELTLP